MTHWLLRDRGADIRIELGSPARSDDSTGEMSRKELDALLWRGLTARDPQVGRVLEAIHLALRGGSAPAGEPWAHGPDFERSLAHDLRFAASSGWLRVVRLELTRGGLSIAPTDDSSVEKRAPEVEPDAWIAIELIDEEKNPVPNVAYRIECSDGRVRTGTTNISGKAREEGLHYGNCKVSFPQLNAPDWKKVG